MPLRNELVQTSYMRGQDDIGSAPVIYLPSRPEEPERAVHSAPEACEKLSKEKGL